MVDALSFHMSDRKCLSKHDALLFYFRNLNGNLQYIHKHGRFYFPSHCKLIDRRSGQFLCVLAGFRYRDTKKRYTQKCLLFSTTLLTHFMIKLCFLNNIIAELNNK